MRRSIPVAESQTRMKSENLKPATIASMTAFARAEAHTEHGYLAVEIRSLNSRHLDLSLRLPDALRDREYAWREQSRQRIVRGKVEISVRYEPILNLADSLRVDHQRVRQLLAAIGEIEALVSHGGPINPLDILRMPGVMISTEPTQVSILSAALLTTADTLLAQAQLDFMAMREREGAAIHSLIESRLCAIESEIAIVQARLPQIVKHYRERLLARLLEAQIEPINERLEQELIIFVQKMDVAEELDRLVAHITEIRRVLNSGGAVGRRLDFLMQELNREANTLGSKAVTADSSLSSVELKVLIEQMREQIQNIE